MIARVGTALLAASAGALLLASSGWAPATREGGTFNLAVQSGIFDTIDPALVDGYAEVQVLAPACATLMAYPNKPPPEGLRLKPDLAAAEPVVSKDGRTYTFTVRRGLRFSTGAPVTAASFARALERLFSPQLKTEFNLPVLGAVAYREGRATTLRGVTAKSRTLTVRLTKRVACGIGKARRGR